MATDSVLVGRKELDPDLTALDLNDAASGYQILSVSFGATQVEKTYAQTVPHVGGEQVTHMRPTNGTYTIRVLVTGSTSSQLHSRMRALERAFQRQYTFPVTHSIDGVDLKYTCLAADSFGPDSQGGGIDEVWHGQHQQPMSITGPHRGLAPSTSNV